MSAPKWLLWLIGPLVADMPRDFINNSIGLPGPDVSSAKAQKELGLTFIDFKVRSLCPRHPPGYHYAYTLAHQSPQGFRV